MSKFNLNREQLKKYNGVGPPAGIELIRLCDAGTILRILSHRGLQKKKALSNVYLLGDK